MTDPTNPFLGVDDGAAPPPGDEAPNPFLGIPDGDETPPLQASLQAASRGDADRHARALVLSRKTGLPADLVARNMDDVARRVSLREADAEALTREHPELAGWLRDPNNATIAKDDIPSLRRLSEAVRSFREAPDRRERMVADTKRNVRQHLERRQAERTAALAAAGRPNPNDTLDPVERAFGGRIPSDEELDAAVRRGLFDAGPERGTTMRLLTGAGRGFARTAAGIVGLGIDGPTGVRMREAVQEQERAERAIFGEPGWLTGTAVGVVESLPGMLLGGRAGRAMAPGIGAQFQGAALLTRSQRLAQFLANPATAARASQGAGAAGSVLLTTDKKGLRAVSEAAIEAIGTFLGGSRGLEPLLAGAGLKRGAKAAAGDVLAEGVEEGATGGAQAIADLLITDPAALSRAEGWVQAGDEAARGAVGGMMLVPAFRAGAWVQQAIPVADFEAIKAEVARAAAIQDAAHGQASQEVEQAAKAQRHRATLDAAGKLAVASKLAERSPEDFATYLQTVTPADARTYFQAEEWDAYWRSQGQDPAAMAERLGAAESYREGHDTGQDVAVPLARFVAEVARTEHYAPLVELARPEPGAPTATEAETILNQDPAPAAEALRAVDEAAADPREQQAAEIREEVARQLEATGRRTPDQARTEAALVARLFATAAQRMGTTPSALWKQAGLRVESAAALAQVAEPLQPAAEAAARTLNQAPVDAAPVDTAGLSPAARTWMAALPANEQRALAQSVAHFQANPDPQGDLGNLQMVLEFAKRRGRVLNQGEDERGPRGQIRIGNRTLAISLLEGADLSTFAHELGHAWLEVMGDLAAAENAPQQIRDDYAAVLRWLGVESREQIGTKQHEQWARGWEAYLFEGKAPSSALRRAFTAFREWLVGVYRTLTALRVELSDEVRGVMDRLVATDAEIAEAQQDITPPIFADAKAAGMSEEQFAAYRKLADEQIAEARDRVAQQALRDAARARTQWWRQEEARIRAEVEAEVDARPDVRALAFLRDYTAPDGSPLADGTPRFQLNATKAKALAEAAGVRLPKGVTGTTEGGEVGADPDAAAQVLGFESGDALIRALATTPTRRQLVREETAARMRAKHGDRVADGKVRQDARDALASGEGREKLVRAEIEALRRQARKAKPAEKVAADKARAEERAKAKDADAKRRADDRLAGQVGKAIDALARDAQIEGLREAARNERLARMEALDAIPDAQQLAALAERQIAAKRVRDIRPHEYEAAARRAARDAYEAMARGEIGRAIAAKQQELLSLALHRAAVRAREDVDAIVEYARRFDRAETRGRIGKAGGPYLEQIDALLDRYEFRPKSLRQLDRRAGLRAFVEQMRTDGVELDIPDAVLDDARALNYQEVPLEELRGVRDAVKQIEHQARLKNALLAAKDHREFMQAVADIRESIEAQGLPRKFTDIETDRPQNRAAHAFAAYFAAHRRISSIARQMDGGKDGGPVWQRIIRPLNDAADRKAVMQREANEKLGAILDKLGLGVAGRWELSQKRQVPGTNLQMSRQARLAVALNWGNEDNRQRITDGYAGRLSERDIAAVLSSLTAQEWQVVQEVWDFLDSYWPEIAAKQKRVTGLEPEKVEAAPFTVRTADGQTLEMRGGYYPIAYDPRQSDKTEREQQAELAKGAVRAAYLANTTRRGHTKARAEAGNRPVVLSLSPLFRHVTNVIHDLTHHEALIDAQRILREKDTAKLMRETYGPDIFDQFNRAMEAIAQENEQGEQWAKAFAHLRTGAVVAGMGWNPATAALQILGFTNSAVRIGPKWVARGLARWLTSAKSMEGSIAWIHERSEFMRTRADTMQQEINDARNKVDLPVGAPPVVKASMFYLIQQMQKVVDVPTWLGAYEKAMAQPGTSEADAIALADQAVRDAQGGGQTVDKALVQRGPEFFKIWTTFFSYFVTTWNLAAEKTRETRWRDPVSVARLAVNYLLLFSVPAILGDQLKDWLRGDEDEDDLTKQMLKSQLAYLSGTLVGLREFSGMAQGFYDYQGPAGARFFGETGKLIKQVAQGEADEALLRAVNQTAGIVFHYPAGQVDRMVRGFAAAIEGEAGPLAPLFGPPRK